MTKNMNKPQVYFFADSNIGEIFKQYFMSLEL